MSDEILKLTAEKLFEEHYRSVNGEGETPPKFELLSEHVQKAWMAVARQMPAINPLTKEYMLRILAKLPSTTPAELRGAQFPEEVIDAWNRMWNRPPIGKVHAATAREYRSNCSMEFFQNHSQLNQWFADNIGYIMFDWKPDEATGGIYALIGQVLTPEEQADLDIRADIINEMTEAKKKEKAEVIEKHVAELRAKQEENERLIKVGKKCESNHAAVIEENRKLKKGKKE